MSRFGGYGRGGPRFGGDPYRPRQDANFSGNWQTGSASGIGGWPRPGRGRGGFGSQDNRPRFHSRNKTYEPRFSGNNNNARPRPLLGIAPSTLLKSGTTGTGGGNKNETELMGDIKIAANSTQDVAGQQTKPLEVKSGLLPTPNNISSSESDTRPKSNNGTATGDSDAPTKSGFTPKASQGKQTTAAPLLTTTTTPSISKASSSTTPTKSILKVSSTTSFLRSSPSTTVSTNSNVKANSPKPNPEKSSSEEEENYCSFCKIKFTSSENYAKHTRGLMHTQKVMEVESGNKAPDKEPDNSNDSTTLSGKSSQSFIKQNQKNNPPTKGRTENIKLKSIFDHKSEGKQKEEYGYGDDGNQKGSDQEISYDKDPALAKYGLSKELLDTANLEPVIKPPKERDLNPEECGKKRFHTDYHCKLCNIKCTGAQSFQAHLAGNKHSTNVDNYFHTGKSTVKRTDVSLVLCNRKSLTKELTSIITEPIVGLSYVTEFHKEDAKAVVKCVCNLCESKCDEHTIVPHLLGNRHRLNYMKEHHIEFHDHCKKYGGKKNQTQYIAELTEDIEKIDGKGEPSVKMCVEENFVEEVYASETLLTTRRPPLLKRPGPAGDKFDGAKRSKVEAYDESENYQGEEHGDYGYNEPIKKAPRSNDYNEDYVDEQYGQDQYGNEKYGTGQFGNEKYGSEQYANKQYGSEQYDNKQYGSEQYGNDQYDQYGNEEYGSDQYGKDQYSDQYTSDQHGSGAKRRDEYQRGRGEREEKDRFNQDSYLTKEDIYRMDPYSEQSNDGYTSTAPIVKEYGHAKEQPKSLMDDFPKGREPLLDEFPQNRDQSYGGYSQSKEPLIRNPPLLGRDPSFPEPLLKDPLTHKEPLLKNPPVSLEPLLNQPSSGPARQPLLQNPQGEYGQDRSRSWDNGNTQQSQRSASWDEQDTQKFQRSGSWDTQQSQRSGSWDNKDTQHSQRPGLWDTQQSQRSGSWDNVETQQSQRSGSWDNGNTQQSQRSGSWDNKDTQQSQIPGLWDTQQSPKSSSWDNRDTQQSQNSQSDNYSGQNNYQSSYNDGAAGRYSDYPLVPNEPPVPPVPTEAPPLPSTSYEDELAERRREEKLVEERIEKEVQHRLQNILSMKKPDPDRKSSRSGGMSDMSVLMQSLSNSLISNEDEAEMALQVSNALTQALLKYRLKTLPPEMVRDALPNYSDIVSQLDVSQSPASSKSLKSTPATPDTSYLHSQNIPGLMPTNQWPISSSSGQIPMQVDQYNAMSQWPQMVQPGTNHLVNQQQPVQSQYMQQQTTPQSLMISPLMSQQQSSAPQPLIPSTPALIVQHAMGYAKTKQSNPQNQQQLMSSSLSAPQMVPPVSEIVSGASLLGAGPKTFYSDVPPEYLHHRLMQGPPSVSRPQRRP